MSDDKSRPHEIIENKDNAAAKSRPTAHQAEQPTASCKSAVVLMSEPVKYFL